MLSIAAKEWMAEGKAEGRAEGRAEAKADTLLRQLHRRFTVLPNGVEDRVRAAVSDRLDEWLDRILDAQTLSDVFGPEQPH